MLPQTKEHRAVVVSDDEREKDKITAALRRLGITTFAADFENARKVIDLYRPRLLVTEIMGDSDGDKDMLGEQLVRQYGDQMAIVVLTSLNQFEADFGRPDQMGLIRELKRMGAEVIDIGDTDAWASFIFIRAFENI